MSRLSIVLVLLVPLDPPTRVSSFKDLRERGGPLGPRPFKGDHCVETTV